MQAWEADELGKRVAQLVQDGETNKAFTLLAPVLARRTPFRLLGRIGERVGTGSPPEVTVFLDRIAGARSEGGGS